MYIIHFSDNIARLRREKKMTQEQLAEFVGVTKASVSKWETGQSMPDVVLLPRLAAYFDVSIDELLGYEARLSKEQIQKIYMELAQCFANEPFEDVMERSRALVKQYYSCYEFVSQIICLWMNHYMLSTKDRSMEILKEAEALCQHILTNCQDIGLCSDVLMLKASILLLLGRTGEVMEELEAVYNPCSLSSAGESILLNAYLKAGEMTKANSYTQISMYNQLTTLIDNAKTYLVIHKENLALCEENFRRICLVAEAFQVETLNFNCMVLLYYEMAIIYCQHGKKEEAIRQLQRFIILTDEFLSSDSNPIHGDAYFDTLDEWIDKLALGGNAPRNKRIIYASMITVFDTPSFCCLEDEEEYKKLKEFAKRRGEEYEKSGTWKG